MPWQHKHTRPSFSYVFPLSVWQFYFTDSYRTTSVCSVLTAVAAQVSKRGPQMWLQDSQMIQDKPPWSSFSWLLVHHELHLSESSLCFGTPIKHNSVLTKPCWDCCLFCYPPQMQGWDLGVPVAKSPPDSLAACLNQSKHHHTQSTEF